MKLVRILSTIGIVVSVPLVVIFATLLLLSKYVNEDKITENSSDSSIVKISNIGEETEEEIIPEETDELYTLRESGWIPSWAFDLGFESLKNNKEILDTVNPVLYMVDSTGNITGRNISYADIEELVAYCKDNDIRIIPTVGSYDLEAMSSFLASEEQILRNVATIMREVDTYGFDGIEIDFEAIAEKNKEGYFFFLSELEDSLGSRDKVLSVTVFPQWSNAEYTENNEIRSVQDYTEIGEIADEVKIMAYDYTSPTSGNPGPIAPVNWIRKVLDYAIRYISEEKIWLGVHLYSYEWTDGQVVALTYTSVRNILNSSSINTTFLDDIGEGYAEFGCYEDSRCILYYQNEEGVGIRRDIAEEYNIAGVSYWRLGGEMEILK